MCLLQINYRTKIHHIHEEVTLSRQNIVLDSFGTWKVIGKEKKYIKKIFFLIFNLMVENIKKIKYNQNSS